MSTNKEIRSQNMRQIKAQDTKIERILAKAMWEQGLRYRKQCKDVFGRPDFCFKGKKIAIFCDSEFWHGKKFLEGEKFKTNKEFWETKINKNIQRDKEVNQILEKEGWKVLRFWGKDIEKNSLECIEKIKNVWSENE